VRAIHRFAEEHNIPRLKFEKGQDKEKTAFPLLQAAAKQGQDRVVLIGSAQEKASIWKSWPRQGQEKPPTPTGTGGDRWPTSIISTFTCGINNGVWDLLQDQRLCSFSPLALAQRP
jgi:hypothetical protein